MVWNEQRYHCEIVFMKQTQIYMKRFIKIKKTVILWNFSLINCSLLWGQKGASEFMVLNLLIISLCWCFVLLLMDSSLQTKTIINIQLSSPAFLLTTVFLSLLLYLQVSLWCCFFITCHSWLFFLTDGHFYLNFLVFQQNPNLQNSPVFLFPKSYLHLDDYSSHKIKRHYSLILSS